MPVAVIVFLGCGHCKKAKPEFTQAADKFADDSKVDILHIFMKTVFAFYVRR